MSLFFDVANLVKQSGTGKICGHSGLIEKYEFQSKRHWEKVAGVLCLLENKTFSQNGAGANPRAFCAYWKLRFPIRTVLEEFRGRSVLIEN